MAHHSKHFALLIVAAALLLPVYAEAAEAGALLSITGNRIDYREAPSAQPATETIAAYYTQLSESLQQRLGQHRRTLATLLSDYEFALNAADTAEMNSILSKVTAEWVKVLRIHNDEFTDPARRHLRQLYGEVYPWLASR